MDTKANDSSWVSPYATCFRSCLQCCSNQYYHLFSDIERQIIECIVTELNNDALLLFSKFFMKKYEYFRTTNMHRTFNNRFYNLMTYAERGSVNSPTNTDKLHVDSIKFEFRYGEYDDIAMSKLNECLKVLIRCHLIESFDNRDTIVPGDFSANIEHIRELIDSYCSNLGPTGPTDRKRKSDLDALWSVISHNLSLTELKSLLKLMNFSNVSSCSKDQCISLLWDKCYSQRSIVSAFSKKGSSKEEKGGANGLSTRISQLITTKVLSCSGNAGGLPDRIIRVNPSILQLVRRIQRLFYICSDSMSWVGGTALSTMVPCHVNTPLLVAFHKTRFPVYAVSQKVDLFSNHLRSSLKSNDKENADMSRLAFLQWETSNELRFIYENCGAGYSYANLMDPSANAVDRALTKATLNALVERIVALVSVFDGATSTDYSGSGGCATGVETSTNSSASGKNRTGITIIEECGRSVCVLSDSDSEDDCIFIESNSKTSAGTTISSKISNIPPGLSEGMFPCSLVARHLLENCTCVPNSKLSLRTAIALIAGVCAMKYNEYDYAIAQNGVPDLETPEYCKTLSAGTVLASILHLEAFEIMINPNNEVDSCEEEASGTGSGAGAEDYFMISCEILRFLLSPPVPRGSVGSSSTTSSTNSFASDIGVGLGGGYTPHRRGRWYDRLCINLERYVATNTTSSTCAHVGEAVEADYIQSAAMQLCYQYLNNSLCDPYVELGDRLPLAKKLQKMGKKFNGSNSLARRQSVVSASLSHGLWDLILVNYYYGGEYTAANMLSVLMDDVKREISSNNSEWTCDICTFVNPAHAVLCLAVQEKRKSLKRKDSPAVVSGEGVNNSVCGMCGTKKPESDEIACKSNSNGDIDDDAIELDSTSTVLDSITNLEYLYEGAGFGAINRIALNKVIEEYTPPVIYIHGKRFYLDEGGCSNTYGAIRKTNGNNATALIRPKFVGYNDEILDVESYILHIFQHPALYEFRGADGLIQGGGDHIDLNVREEKIDANDCQESNPKKKRAKIAKKKPTPPKRKHIDDSVVKSVCAEDANVDLFIKMTKRGGWQGWHCEGSLLKYIFMLLMWDVIYYSPTDDDGGAVWNVFASPYQVVPLDFNYPELYLRSRMEIANERLKCIEAYTRQELLDEIGRVYRLQYKCQCATSGLWTVALKTLQAVALCLGSEGAACICKIFNSNYKYFSAGMPDLLMCRVTRSRIGGDVEGDANQKIDSDIEALHYWPVPDGDSSTSETEVLDFESWIGRDWKNSRMNADAMSRRSRFRFGDGGDKDDLLGQSTKMNAVESTTDPDEQLTSDSSAAIAEVEESSILDAVGNTEGGLDAESEAGVEFIEDQGDRVHHNFQCFQEDIILPHASISTSSGVSWEYHYEFLLLEVKSPTDHLQNKQSIWLQLLNMKNIPSYVCRVFEK